MSPSYALSPPPISSPASHTLNIRKSTVMLTPSFILTTISAPVLFETSGALNKEGETVLKQIIRFASKREGITHMVYAARASAQQILNRDFKAAVDQISLWSYSEKNAR